MTEILKDIFQLEDLEEFDKAFDLYSEIYAKDKSNYQIWKHFYFFLWTAIEDAPSSFHDRINLRNLLQVMFVEGKNMFANRADFNFIAGYTVSIFPYEYGEYNDLEKEGNQMLLKATQLEPANDIYKIAFLGSLATTDLKTYDQIKINVRQKVMDTFKGAGSLNKYFRQVF